MKFQSPSFFGRTGARSDKPKPISSPFFKVGTLKTSGQFESCFYGVRTDQWSRSDLTKIRFFYGPNCP